ncbi:MAG: sensor histidine kinase [Pseudomonadota bacterium]
MTSGLFSGNLFRGLAVRVLFFLSLALLPIGLLAISQTQQLSLQNRETAELSLLAITEKASAAERRILQEAFSAGEALASTITLFRNDPAACTLFLEAYQQANPGYALVGFISRDGIMRCASTGQTVDFSDHEALQAALDNPRRRVTAIENGRASGRRVTNITVPAYEDGEVIGFMTLSIPASTYAQFKEEGIVERPISLMTFNRDGALITSEKGDGVAETEAPADIALKLLTQAGSIVFTSSNRDGIPRIYTVQEIVPNAVFALSVWPENTPLLNPALASRLSTLLPIAMWIASLVVAFWALNRLVIRHIRKLGRAMRRFAINRSLPRNPLGSDVPAELVEIEATFVNMGESILKDEATLEDSLREKNILLKEVHHRVKNNLQLISSIMNMQIRQAKTEDASRVLRRLQERILGLATVHKNLYRNDTLKRVDAGSLLGEIVNQALAMGLAPGSNVQVEQSYSPITLEADNAAPLTLLVSEAMTNALKYVDQGKKDGARIAIDLSENESDQAVLTITNTTGGRPEHEGTGLGSKLIVAFARQLNGHVYTEEEAGLHTLRIDFPIPRTEKPVYDY